jgi:hypothetical protein
MGIVAQQCVPKMTLGHSCIQDGESTEVSRPGGQGREEVARGGKAPRLTIAGYQATTKQSSWGRALEIKSPFVK